MTLEVEEVKSGEEDEEELFMRRAKLYRFCRATAEWKERALGDARILKNKQYAFSFKGQIVFVNDIFFARLIFDCLHLDSEIISNQIFNETETDGRGS